MSDPDIPILDGDIRFEDRHGCLVLVDPQRGPRGDVGSTWPAEDGLHAVRFGLVPPSAEPLPRLPRDAAMRLLLDVYRVFDHAVTSRLEEQRPRFSFGFPQIVDMSRD